jgi:hypothetical protein
MPDWFVGNYGINGSGTVMQYALFDHEVKAKTQPGDIVLVMFFQNDFGDNVDLPRIHAELREGRVVLVPPPGAFASPTAAWLKDHSYLFNLLALEADRWKLRSKRAKELNQADRLVTAGEREPQIAVTRRFLELFREACEERKARLLVAYIPGQAELGERVPSVNEPENDAAFRAAFFATAQAAGVETLDLLPALLAAKKAAPDVRLTFPSDMHWTERAHEVAARAIADWQRGVEK